MRGKLIPFVAVALTALLLSACSSEPAGSENIPDGFSVKYITFPTSLLEKNEYNASVFDIEPFTLEICLPEGWNIQEAAVMSQSGQESFPSVDGIFSVQCLLNEAGKPTGSVGYSLAPIVEETNRDPMALFAGITLAQHRFDCKETFTPIVETERQLVALADVIYSYSVNEQSETGDIVRNCGILLRDETVGVYIAIEIQAGALTEEQLMFIATSLSLSSTG